MWGNLKFQTRTIVVKDFSVILPHYLIFGHLQLNNFFFQYQSIIADFPVDNPDILVICGVCSISIISSIYDLPSHLTHAFEFWTIAFIVEDSPLLSRDVARRRDQAFPRTLFLLLPEVG